MSMNEDMIMSEEAGNYLYTIGTCSFWMEGVLLTATGMNNKTKIL